MLSIQFWYQKKELALAYKTKSKTKKIIETLSISF